MITRQELEGKWKQLKGQIREQWSVLTEDDLQRVKGNAEQLVGIIQEKTGQTKQQVEDHLEKLMASGQSAVHQATETARQFADTASQQLQETYRQAEQHFDAGFHEAKDMVRSRPMESVVAAFGAGIISGVVVALLLRGNQRA